MRALAAMIFAMTTAIATVVGFATNVPHMFEIRVTTVDPTPDTEEIVFTNQATKATEIMHVVKTPVLDETMVHSAAVQTQEHDPYSYVEVVFTDMGRDRFALLTRQNIERRVVIFVDGALVVAPIIKAEITGGKFWLSGRMSTNEASELTHKINQAIKK